MFRANERDWMAPNPQAGAWINVYLRSAPKEPVVVTITDKSGKPVRTLRSRADAGLNRIVWNLRHDLPGGRPEGPAPGMEDVPAAVRERFGGGNQGPAVTPGEYDVTVKAGTNELTGTVTVRLDPGVQASAADLEAQLKASFEAAALAARVNVMVERVETIVAQLAAADAQAAKQTPPPAYRASVAQALAKLKTFKDQELTRPIAGLGYRQYPRLREDVQSLVGYLGRGFRAPNEGEIARLKDLTGQVGQAEAKLDALVSGDIPPINDALKGVPRISTR
jgi:hypothetical protein